LVAPDPLPPLDGQQPADREQRQQRRDQAVEGARAGAPHRRASAANEKKRSKGAADRSSSRTGNVRPFSAEVSTRVSVQPLSLVVSGNATARSPITRRASTVPWAALRIQVSCRPVAMASSRPSGTAGKVMT